MAIKHQIWKVGDTPKPLKESHLTSEQSLEDMMYETQVSLQMSG